MTTEQFFNPYNLNHIRAYHFLTKHGHWPEGVVPSTVRPSSLDTVHVQAKMAEAWMLVALEHTDGKVKELLET